MAGCLLAALTYFPLFQALTHYANPALAGAQANDQGAWSRPTRRTARSSSTRSARVDFTTSCDIAKRCLAQQLGAATRTTAAPAGTPATVTIGDKVVTAPRRRPTAQPAARRRRARKAVGASRSELGDALKAAGYPAKAEPARDQQRPWWCCCILTLPGDLRDDGLRPDRGDAGRAVPDAHPLHVDVACPTTSATAGSAACCRPTAFAIVAATGNIYYGLWYPIIVAAVTFVIGMLFIRETKDVDIYARD